MTFCVRTSRATTIASEVTRYSAVVWTASKFGGNDDPSAFFRGSFRRFAGAYLPAKKLLLSKRLGDPGVRKATKVGNAFTIIRTSTTRRISWVMTIIAVPTTCIIAIDLK